MDMRNVEIRELRSITARDFEEMGYGYTSDARYEVRRTETGGRTTITVELIQLERPYFKIWPCTGDFTAELSEALNHGMSLGAYVEDRLVGVAIAQPRSWNNTLWIETIHINAGHRGMGIGTRLMQGIESIAREKGFRIIGLETQNTNAPAIAFYRKMGYVLDGFDVSFYSNNNNFEGEIAFFMKKHLH